MPDTTFRQLFSEDGSFQEAVAPPRQQRPTKASSALGPGDQRSQPGPHPEWEKPRERGPHRG